MHVTTVVIGAGHNGLAMSHRLTERSIDHVVLERGEVANSWRRRRPTLRLLTPNSQTRLPGIGDLGAPSHIDPDGYMAVPAVADLVERYACRVDAPVHTETAVTRLSRRSGGEPARRFDVETDRGRWTCTSVVLAAGANDIANVPAIAEALPPDVVSIPADAYRHPDQLDDRGVLVVGASASGAQLADEIRGTGRAVTLAVGEHVRLPRRYRGRDIFWWLDAAGVLDQRFDEVDDLVRARHLPSPQLVGADDGRAVDLASLAGRGVRLVGRLTGIDHRRVTFSGGLANVCALADLKANRLLGTLDEWAAGGGIGVAGAPVRLAPTPVPSRPTLDIPLAEIGTVVWATGYRPDLSWVDLPVLDRRGRVRHDGGVVVDAPGAYLLGANLLRRRRSSYLSGAAADTDDLAAHLHRSLDAVAAGRTVLGGRGPGSRDPHRTDRADRATVAAIIDAAR